MNEKILSVLNEEKSEENNEINIFTTNLLKK